MPLPRNTTTPWPFHQYGAVSPLLPPHRRESHLSLHTHNLSRVFLETRRVHISRVAFAFN
jgi:hypothetical protein